MAGPLPLEEQEFPRFSAAEYSRRQQALSALMDRRGVDHLLLVADERRGCAPQWLTGWPGTTEALAIFRAGERIAMSVEWRTHVPLARRIAHDVEVHWGERRGIEHTIEALGRRGARRVGLIGPLSPRKLKALETAFVVELLDADYARLRRVKSDEEFEWLRIGAGFSDAGIHALLHGIRPGLSERGLAHLVERGYAGRGGATLLRDIGVTSMAEPQLCVPPPYASSRRVRRGDVVLCEISASFWGYGGRVLRSLTVDADPTPLYRRLHETAEAVFDAVTGVLRAGCTPKDISAAARRVEACGFALHDDLLHEHGGGEAPEPALEENMAVVVRPNVVTPDLRAGVQVGELLRVTKTGFERLHAVPRGFLRVESGGRTPLLPDSIV